jgi:hypothetical protein
MMTKSSIPVLLVAAIALSPAGPVPGEAAPLRVPFKESRIYIEFNQTANDLGYHISLDAEDWQRLQIVNPVGRLVFAVEGFNAYQRLGMTELFFEGAEPNLDEFPLDQLLALFPEGPYTFAGKTVEDEDLVSMSTLSHAVPNGPGGIAAALGPNGSLVISWHPVTTVPAGFPARPISIIGYQVIVASFQVTVPATVTSVTVPPEFVRTLAAGEILFEVLAIDVSGNQSITESSFVKP